MIKSIGKFSLLVAICTLLKLSLSSSSIISIINGTNEEKEVAAVQPYFTFNNTDTKFTPTLGKSFVGFKEALAFKESRGDYFTVNQFGYLGKYQFGKETLKTIGIYNTEKFLNNPELQEKAFLANLQRNKWILRKDIKRFKGKTINNILITESGILAAAHLAGPGSVKKFLRSYGENGFKDANGASVSYYMKKFSGYHTASIKPIKNAKASKL